MKIQIVLFLIFVTNVSGQSLTNFGTDSGTSGDYGTYFGFAAGKVVTGAHNTFIGTIAGQDMTTGASNTFVGSSSGSNTTIGKENVFVGVSSGYDNLDGSYNTLIGRYAGRYNSSGNKNVYIGYRSGYNNLSGAGNIFIGSDSGYNETGSNKLYIDNSSTNTPLIYGDFATGQLGINTSFIPDSYALAVNGKIMVEELKVKLSSAWPDYVFKDDYELTPLDDLQIFIKDNGHLPEIPSAVDIEEAEGYSLGEINIQLLRKIEELTLYLIEQNETNKKQQELINLLIK